MKRMTSYKYSGSTDSTITERELKGRRIARKAAAEGIVLLKNEEGFLPLRSDSKLALLGGGAVYTVKGGTGSGDVNERKSVSIWEGLIDSGIDIVTEPWLNDYSNRYIRARAAWRDLIIDEAGEDPREFFQTYTTHPFSMPEGRAVMPDDIRDADAVVYVISRIAGEGKDRVLAGGDYYLTGREMDDLRMIDEMGIPAALLINAGGPVEISDAADLKCVKAVLFMSQAGQEGGNAVADILLGKVNPSGRLASTWARRYEDYPNAEIFSGMSGDVTKEYYSEGIYTGYRYFDTFDVKPLYGFGYGLSYTSFEYSDIHVEQNGDISVSACIINTGSFAGKEVMEVYISCPQTGLLKEKRRLAGFAKTAEILPGESAELCVTIPAKQFASFDEKRSAWIIGSGEYGVWVGGSLEGSSLCYVIENEEEQILEKTERICPLREKLPELSPSLKMNDACNDTEKYKQLPHFRAVFPSCANEQHYKNKDRISKEAAEMARKLPARDMIPLLMGEIGKGQGALGAAGIRVPGSAGETSSAFIESLGLAPAVLADGPAGLRLTKNYYVDTACDKVCDPGFMASLEHGLFAQPERPESAMELFQYCTAIPVGTLLAQTFDTGLIEEVGAFIAEEMMEFHVSWWLAPGMNIQRNPLCGRNFEYYSEDPLVSGKIAAAMTKGVQKNPGTGTTIKHFACNNQEDNRTGSDSIVSERALREIYLRGFEIAIRESQPACIMTSYNLVNGVHAANSYDLCTRVAREEWGFRGIIMTDWTTTLPESGSIPHKCVLAGNDLIMPGMQSDYEEICKAYDTGVLSDEDIQKCAERLIDAILRSNAYEN